MVASGSTAEGSTIEDLGEHAGDIWVSIVVRTSGVVPVVILADPELRDTLAALFDCS